MDTAQTQPKEKKGLGRLWKKFRAAFKNKEITRATTSTSTTTQPAPSKPKEETPKPSEPAAPATVGADSTERTASAEAPMQTDIDRRLERARALFKKYDFELDESEWKLDELKPRKPTERVQKTIRMRVKYTCHSCNTVFGHDKICISCQHPRCAKCVRYPPKKAKGKKQESTTVAPVEEKAPENKCACHECQTGFEIGAEECPNCHHKVCDRCLKEALIAVSPSPQAAEPEKKPAPSTQPATESEPVTAS